MIVGKEGLLKRLEGLSVDDKGYSVELSRDGGVTVLCRRNGVETYLHSRYNPAKSGEQLAKSIYDEGGSLVVYGLGLGYHIAALRELLTENQALYVFETCLETTKIAFEETDILSVLEEENVFFCCSDDLGELMPLLDSLVNGEGCKLLIYPPSLNVIPERLSRLKEVLTEFKAASDMLPVFSERMKSNAEINRAAGYKNGLRMFGGAFKRIPAIVVAAGASLNLNAADLGRCTDKALVVCVTRAARTLRENGITPDFYVCTDAGRYLRRHLDYAGGSMSSPLFLLATADSDAADYKGQKLLMYGRDSAPAEDKDCFVETGGSVATAAISLCVRLGADPIVLIGQDLCYGLEKNHSDGRGFQMLPFKARQKVLANDGNEYFTSGGLHIYLKWIERFIRRNPDTEFLNATALGAVIAGAPNIDLLEFFENRDDVRYSIERIKDARR